MRLSISFGSKDTSTPTQVNATSTQSSCQRQSACAFTDTHPEHNELHRTTGVNTHRQNWSLPWQLKTATLYALCLLVLGFFLYQGWVIFNTFADIAIPIAIAILFTAFLRPAVQWLTGKGLWRSLASALTMLVFFGFIGGLFSLVGAQLANQVPELVEKAQNGFALFPTWVKNLNLPGSAYFDAATISSQLQSMSGSLMSSIAGYVRTVGSTVSHFAAGIILCLFATFFFLYDGQKLLASATGWLRHPIRQQLTTAGSFGWKSLVAYVRAIVIVAAVDGIFVGIGAAVLGSHFYLSIGLLTFLMAFIPLLGAVLSGVVAVLVVFVTLGFWKAVAMLIIYVVVNQLEGNVLHPFLLGKSVDLHPLIVLIGIAFGLTANGIVGALLIVPTMAFLFAFTKKLSATDADGELISVADAS